MKKDVIYSMRMSSEIRDALKKAANREKRTVASLLDKIITDYLEIEGFLLPPDHGKERRKFPRRKITLPATTTLKSGSDVVNVPCVILDISLGGVLVTYPKGSQMRFPSLGKLPRFEIAFSIPQMNESVYFNCDARHMHDTGKEIQVGAAFTRPKNVNLRKLNTYFHVEDTTRH